MVATEQVVILAGGLGTRLRPLTDNLPKPLVPVKGKPFLEWQLEYVRRQGFKDFLFLISYRAQQIIDYFGNGKKWGVRIEYSVEPEPLGTGGALVLAKEKLSSRFCMVNGDSFLACPLNEMASEFTMHPMKVLVSAYDNEPETPVPNNLKVSGHGPVLEILSYLKAAGIEKGYQMVDSGVYVIDRSILDGKIPGQKFQLEDLWPGLIEKKSLYAYAVKQRFYDIGTIERLKEFEEIVSDYF